MIGVKGRFVPCVIRNPLFQYSADGHPALPVPSPSTPGLPAGQAGYCPSAYSFRANSNKSDSYSGVGAGALQRRDLFLLCSSRSNRSLPRWSEKVFHRIFVFL
jgi:hypothetical protein